MADSKVIILFDSLLKNIDLFFEHEKMKVAINTAVKGGMMIGVATAVGGCLMGPLGLFSGAVLSSLTVASTMTSFVAPLAILMTMSKEDKTAIVENICAALNCDFRQIGEKLKNPKFLLDHKEIIIGVVVAFLRYKGFTIQRLIQKSKPQ